MTSARATPVEESIDFEGLTIRFDQQVLRPRPWTVAQSRWAAALLADLPPGPVLELCAGAGHIGLAAAAASPRRVVAVDADPVATRFAATNARMAGMADRVEVRTAVIEDALAAREEFILVIADPPWVRTSQTYRYPEDPLTAIDGGSDGLDVARSCLAVIGQHLAPRGAVLLQLGSAHQADSLGPEIVAAGLAETEVRQYDGGVVVRLGHAARLRANPC